ncbi:unnamed protein product [Calicophoron daubneyi]
MEDKCKIWRERVVQTEQLIEDLKIVKSLAIADLKTNLERLNERDNELPKLRANFQKAVVNTGHDTRLNTITSESVIRQHESEMRNLEIKINRGVVENSLLRQRRKQLLRSLADANRSAKMLTPQDYAELKMEHHQLATRLEELDILTRTQRCFFSNVHFQLIQAETRLRKLEKQYGDSKRTSDQHVATSMATNRALEFMASDAVKYYQEHRILQDTKANLKTHTVHEYVEHVLNKAKEISKNRATGRKGMAKLAAKVHQDIWNRVYRASPSLTE